nr:hypothetical protein [Escherichia coli]
MSRDPPQRRRARARNGVAPYIPASFAGMPGAQATARQGGATGTVAASRGFCVGDGSPKPRQTVSAGSVRQQPAPPDGDAGQPGKP